MNTAQLLRQMKRVKGRGLDDFTTGLKQGGILALRYILDNMAFESHEDMLKMQDFLRDLEMEK